MAQTTLTEARTIVRDMLNTDSSTTWSDTQIDTALDSALSLCMNHYVGQGGTRFNEIVETTTDSSGQLDLSSYNPLKIFDLTIAYGAQNYYPAMEVAPTDRVVDVSETKNLRIHLCRVLEVPGTASNPLVGVASSGRNSTKAFDMWVCVEAARQLMMRDAEQIGHFEAMARDYRAAVMGEPRTGTNYAFPAKMAWPAFLYGYTWLPNSQTIQVVRYRGLF